MDVLDSIFKAYDIRGKVGSELTPEMLTNIGRAFGDWLPVEGPVVVGRDMRPDSASLAEALIQGLLMQGRDVMDIGEITTDMVYFATGNYGYAGGAVVTASHNPGEYNGIKLCRDEAAAVGESTGLDIIKQSVRTKQFKSVTTPGSRSSENIAEAWIDHVLGIIDPSKLKPIKIAVDAGNGMAGAIFPELEPYVPWDVTEMYFELDGSFPNHEANPMKFETLHDMIEVIKKNKLYGGIAFDGDGDRAFLVDETGTVLTGGVMSAMLSEYFLKKYHKSIIITDIRNSHGVIDVINKCGGTPVVARVGHSFIKIAMREHDAPFGGEASGHFFFRDNWYADSGLIAVVVGLYIAALSGKKLSQLREQYTHYHSIPETNFHVDDKSGMIKKIESAFGDVTPNNMDGTTLEFSDGAWINLRPSNTESILRLNIEAPTPERLAELVDKITALIHEGM